MTYIMINLVEIFVNLRYTMSNVNWFISCFSTLSKCCSSCLRQRPTGGKTCFLSVGRLFASRFVIIMFHDDAFH